MYARVFNIIDDQISYDDANNCDIDITTITKNIIFLMQDVMFDSVLQQEVLDYTTEVLGEE